jgi:heme/copper-type cytochrome/quinol oxidase subunit 3
MCWALCANDNSNNGVDLNKIITLILGIIFLSGCTAEFEDNSSEYTQILNKEFKTLGKINIYSYTLNLE